LPRIKTFVLISTDRLKKKYTGIAMALTEKMELAGLALGLAASVAWIAFLGFALSKAIAWLL
jgi:hypothetical protein